MREWPFHFRGLIYLKRCMWIKKKKCTQSLHLKKKRNSHFIIDIFLYSCPLHLSLSSLYCNKPHYHHPKKDRGPVYRKTTHVWPLKGFRGHPRAPLSPAILPDDVREEHWSPLGTQEAQVWTEVRKVQQSVMLLFGRLGPSGHEISHKFCLGLGVTHTPVISTNSQGL